MRGERLWWEYCREVCDYCGGVNQEVKSHRCAGCKTKVYCKVECLNNDKVHLRLCQEEERRKMKPSNSSRREKGRVALEKRYSNLSSLMFHRYDPFLFEFEYYHNTNITLTKKLYHLFQIMSTKFKLVPY